MKHELGENIGIEIKGDVATITIDLKHRGQRSASGKTLRVASTMGNVKIPNTEVTIGLNAYVKE